MGQNEAILSSFILTLSIPLYIYKMVAQNILSTYDVKEVFSEKKIGVDESFDVTKFFQQVEMPDLLNMCA